MPTENEMKMNKTKTKIMIVLNEKKEVQIRVEGELLEQVGSYKIKVYKIICRRRTSKIGAAEMKYMRRVKGVTRRDKIRNTHTYRRVKSIINKTIYRGKTIGMVVPFAENNRYFSAS